MSKYKIGIIVTWFGVLPSYFNAWLQSVEKNNDVDFLCFFDHAFESKSKNIIIHQISFSQMIDLCSKKMDRKVDFKNSYKFCDARPFFGIIFNDYIENYDFWGYCDIDLMFGNIRKFITDDILAKNERIFQYGHLSIFKNCYKMNHLYSLNGGIYSMDEIFLGKAKTTPEEYFGLNRICQKNNIPWYTKVIFADFSAKYHDRLNLNHGLINYDKQIFIWDDGHAYRYYKLNNRIVRDEFIYMHWQKKKPVIIGDIESTSSSIICPTKIISINTPIKIDELKFEDYNPVLSERQLHIEESNYRKKKINDFLKSNLSTKKIWLRQIMYRILENRLYQ